MLLLVERGLSVGKVINGVKLFCIWFLEYVVGDKVVIEEEWSVVEFVVVLVDEVKVV